MSLYLPLPALGLQKLITKDVQYQFDNIIYYDVGMRSSLGTYITDTFTVDLERAKPRGDVDETTNHVRCIHYASILCNDQRQRKQPLNLSIDAHKNIGFIMGQEKYEEFEIIDIGKRHNPTSSLSKRYMGQN